MKGAIQQIRKQVQLLQADGYNVAVSWAYGRPRLCDVTESRYIGPRLPHRQMLDYLDGIRVGIELEQERVRVEAAKEGN